MAVASYHRNVKPRHGGWRLGLLCAALAWTNVALAAPPDVLVSIKPLHALAARVMHGVGQPKLLIPAAASPHTYVLRPSDARRLNGAAALFWVGPGLESFLPRTLEGLSVQRAVAMMDLPGMALLPIRAGGAWEVHHHDEHDHGQHEATRLTMDAHLWLDPANARTMVKAMARVLQELDPQHADRYAANALKADADLVALEQRLQQQLAPVRSTPFMVFHDAFQYFERRFGLTGVGSITLSPDQPPGARRLQELRARVTKRGVGCVFSEPQFRAGVVETVVEGSHARSGVLDPYGLTWPDDENAYDRLLEEMARALLNCLSVPPGGSIR